MKETMSGRIIKQAALQRHLKTMVDRALPVEIEIWLMMQLICSLGMIRN